MEPYHESFPRGLPQPSAGAATSDGAVARRAREEYVITVACISDGQDSRVSFAFDCILTPRRVFCRYTVGVLWQCGYVMSDWEENLVD